MRKNISGFYTLEASIILPLVILAVLSLGYFMKVEGAWENCMHIAVDESCCNAAEAYPLGIAGADKHTLESRILEENPEIGSVEISNIIMGYSDGCSDKLTSFRIRASMGIDLPLGFSRTFQFESKIKYRGFTGVKTVDAPMGAEGLEYDLAADPVTVFPLAGEKFHSESCTYVNAEVTEKVLTQNIKNNYNECSICNSGSISIGSIVLCFDGEDTAYHRKTCRVIDRNTAVMDKKEAERKGYIPCTKCGG